jgi:hypothetical protein
VKEPKAIYAALAEPFSETFPLKRGGQSFDYITGEQCITRLNAELGLDGWDFEIVEHGRLDDDLWVRGRLTARPAGSILVREQFGSTTLNRGMAPGDSLKGAATDALKKCATLIGVGLYLSSKEEHAGEATQTGSQPNVTRTPTPIAPPQQGVQNGPESASGACPVHGTRNMKEHRFKAGVLQCSVKDGDKWCNREVPKAQAQEAREVGDIPPEWATDDAEYEAVFGR